MSLSLVPLPLADAPAADLARLAEPVTPRLPEPPVEVCFASRLVERPGVEAAR